MRALGAPASTGHSRRRALVTNTPWSRVSSAVNGTSKTALPAPRDGGDCKTLASTRRCDAQWSWSLEASSSSSATTPRAVSVHEVTAQNSRATSETGRHRA
jgi:hypothetical protein